MVSNHITVASNTHHNNHMEAILRRVSMVDINNNLNMVISNQRTVEDTNRDHKEQVEAWEQWVEQHSV